MTVAAKIYGVSLFIGCFAGACFLALVTTVSRVVVARWRDFVAERRCGSPLLERLLKELPEVFEVEVLKHLAGPRAW